MRTTVRASMATVALAAALLSYESLMHLGVLAGYGGLSFLFPIVVDAGAAASCATWLHTRSRQPLLMTWALLAVSVILNGTVHFLTSTHTAPNWWLVVAVAAVPPTVLGLCVHLAVGLGGPDRLPPGGGQPVGPTTSGGTGGSADSTHDTDPLAELLAQGVGRRRLAAELGVTEHQARQLLAGRRNGMAQ